MLAVGSVSAQDGGLGKGGRGNGGGSGQSGGSGGSSGGSGGSGSGKTNPPPPTRGGGSGGSGGTKTSPPPPTRGGGGSGGSGGSGNSQGSGQSRGNGSGSGNSGGSQSGGLGKGGGGNSQGNGNSGGSGSSRGNQGGSSSGSRGNSLPPVNNQGNNGRGQSQSGGSGGYLGRGGNEQSRSGSVKYGSTSNQAATNSRGPGNVPPPPIVRSDSRISREGWGEANRINRNDYRSGYYQYDRNWRDDNFWYPFYNFSFGNNCVPSPWYYYQHLPAYISIVRIEIGCDLWNWNYGNRYNWHYSNNDYSWGGYNNGYGNNSDLRELDDAADSIYDAFKSGRVRYMADLIPDRGSINIELDRYSQYRINGDDFYDLLRDLIEGTRTTDYRIRDVRYFDNRATIIADHEYVDSWNRRQTTRHYFGLEESRRGYQIVSFRTED